MSRGTAIADLVVTDLQDTTRPWNQSGVLSAQRTWLPVYKPEDVKVLKASVFTTELQPTRLTRKSPDGTKGTNWEAYTTVIDLQLAAAFDTNEQIDNLLLDGADGIAEQIFDFYEDGHTFEAGGKTWTVMNAARPQLYYLQRLYSDSVWETAIELTIKGKV